MSGACAAEDFQSVSGLLSGVDCRVAGTVESAYAALYGPFGQFGPVITSALVIYVAVYAYQLILGRGSLSVNGLTRRFLAIGVVVAMSSNWPAYQTVATNVLIGGGEDIADKLLQTGGGKAGVAERLDALLSRTTEIAGAWGGRAPISSPTDVPSTAPTAAPLNAQALLTPPGLTTAVAVNMLWLSAVVIALGSAGVIVVAKIVLGFLLALGPAFVTLAIFPQTRGFFEGWLRTAAANALIPLFAIAAAAAILPMAEPIVDAIADTQARGNVDVKPVFSLFLVAAIFGFLMSQIVAMTTRLTGAWRLPPAREDEASASAPAAATLTAPSPAFDPRITAIVSAVDRASGAEASSARPRSLDVVGLQAPALVGEVGARRVSAGYRGFGAARVARGQSA